MGLGLVFGLILLGCGGRTVEPCVGDCIPIPSGDVTLAAELELPPGSGPHPVLIMIHGSGRGTRQDFAGVVDTYRSIGVGILRYDKRGVGESTGRFRDVTAANSIEAASTVGVSDLYDRIAEDHLTGGEIREALTSFEDTHGYDPVPDIESLTVPALWIYGAQDRSNPTSNDVEILHRIRIEHDKDFTIHVFDNADHDLVDVTTGRPVDAQHIVNRWLAEHVTQPTHI